MRLFSNRPRVIFIASGILGALGASIGLTVAYYADYPAEASIVITLTLIFLLSFLAKRIFEYLKDRIKIGVSS